MKVIWVKWEREYFWRSGWTGKSVDLGFDRNLRHVGHWPGHAEPGENHSARSHAFLTGIGLKPSARIGVRNRLHQLACFKLQKIIRHDQRPDGIPRVAATGR
jgi:hypothetical protein